MKVKDLIALLAVMPQEAEVVQDDFESGYLNVVEGVSVVKANPYIPGTENYDESTRVEVVQFSTSEESSFVTAAKGDA